MSPLIVVVAVLVVLAASLLKQIDWSDKVKQLIVVVLSVVGGAATVASTGGFDNPTNVLETAGLVYAASQLIYAFIFKGTSVEGVMANFNLFGKNADQIDAPPVDEAPDGDVVEEAGEVPVDDEAFVEDEAAKE